MFSSLIIVAFALASQAGGADSRYPVGTAGQPAAASPASGGAPSTITPFNAPPTSPAPPPSVATPNAAPRASTPSAPVSDPYKQSRPSGFTSPQTTQPLNQSRPPANIGQVQPPPGYSAQSSVLNNQAASTPQPPSRASLLMQTMLAPPAGSQLPGEPVRLIDVVRSGSTRNEQTQRIEAYWDLCSSVADYYLGVREQEEVRSLASVALRQSGALQDAEKKMFSRNATSLQAARASQFRLASFIGRGPNNLPLPGDMPHCGTYTTRYEQVFAGRNSAEAQVLAQFIPLRYRELDEAVTGVSSAETWFKEVMSRSDNPGNDGPVRALELVALERRAFVQIARDYNRRIARYSELATPGQISPDRLTGMLIKRPASSTTQPLNRQSGGVGTTGQRTFANENSIEWLSSEKPSMNGGTKVDPAVQPASAKESNDNMHSMVVKPQ